jgi:hypothetical protein
MVNFTKSQPAPECLERERTKTNGNVRNCPEVRTRLGKDFHEKCYLCERHDVSKEVEHFIPHKEDAVLKFDWNNLFLACRHCNGVKSTKTDILNCTNLGDDVLQWLEYRHSVEGLSGSNVSIHALREDERTNNTANLLTKIFNSNSDEGKFYAPILRTKLAEELQNVETTIETLLKRKQDGFETNDDYLALQQHLSIQSPFFAFKYWFLRRHARYSREFQDILAKAPLHAA